MLFISGTDLPFHMPDDLELYTKCDSPDQVISSSFSCVQYTPPDEEVTFGEAHPTPSTSTCYDTVAPSAASCDLFDTNDSAKARTDNTHPDITCPDTESGEEHDEVVSSSEQTHQKTEIAQADSTDRTLDFYS